jgi:hypothetical protein
MQKIKGRTSYKHGQYNKGTKDQTQVTTHDKLNDKGLKPLDKETVKEKQHQNTHKKPLWTQKYSAPKEITTEEQLQNTIKYIKGNRKKHELPPHDRNLQNVIDNMCCGVTEAFKTEYSGGFDVVIGNPPYLGGRDWKDKDGRNYDWLLERFEVAEYQFDMYVLFWEKAIKISKTGGLVGFITPITWLNNQKTQKLREFVLSKTHLYQLLDFSDINVFEDAVVLPMIGLLRNIVPDLNSTCKVLRVRQDSELITNKEVGLIAWRNHELKVININMTSTDFKLLEKIEEDAFSVEYYCDVKFGIKLYETGKGTPAQLKTDAKNKIFESDYKIDNSYRKYLEGKDCFDPYKTRVFF